MRNGKIDFISISLISMLIVLIVVLISSIFSTIDLFKIKNEPQNTIPKRMSRMTLTDFDKQLAKQLMDTNAKIGILESQHNHADWKVYIEGKSFDFLGKSHMERMRNNLPVSSFIHVDSGAPPPEKTGDILHMHSTGVPLWIFFKSIGMDFNKDCITLEDKEKFCNEGSKKLKFYVNGKLNDEFENYAFNDLDKILISYGAENEEEIKQQLAPITDFAKLH